MSYFIFPVLLLPFNLCLISIFANRILRNTTQLRECDVEVLLMTIARYVLHEVHRIATSSSATQAVRNFAIVTQLRWAAITKVSTGTNRGAFWDMLDTIVDRLV